ncbi:hypothetical protein XELAEV_18026234mg [Xenopus laevis]|uniref:Uncharacterized protein n=1 Tax=Xenopus laevis TaxID=8355 RepID=A0A974CV87_XENLA|nr:hypothetical protein XELAEV_18026234mg [Xenopus laevis]
MLTLNIKRFIKDTLVSRKSAVSFSVWLYNLMVVFPQCFSTKYKLQIEMRCDAAEKKYTCPSRSILL